MNSTTSQRRLSVSTWSLHPLLGNPPIWGPGDEPKSYAASELSLLDVPARVREAGIGTLEICHFHLPSLEPPYLSQLRGALDDAGVELFSFLIDAGDVTHPEHGERDEAWIAQMFPIAQALGATAARVIAGKAEPSPEAMQRSISAMRRLSARAQDHGLRLMTENWWALLSRPQEVLQLLDALDGDLGLCLDFGNWKGDTKYVDLAAIAPRAESCHAQANFAGGVVERDDFERCLRLTVDAGFSGPYTLICGGVDDRWDALEQQKQVVLPYLS